MRHGSIVVDKNIVIGFGTGRCGTNSLALLLDAQDGFSISHEGSPLRIFGVNGKYNMILRFWQGSATNTVGDVAWYWLSYLDRVLLDQPKSKAIWLVRDIEEVVESYWAYKKNPEQYASIPEESKGTFVWSWPFLGNKGTKDEIAHSVRMYYAYAGAAYTELPNIYRMPMEDLNDEDKIEDLLSWLGLPKRIHKIKTYHTNKREERENTESDVLVDMQIKARKWIENEALRLELGVSELPDEFQKKF